MRYLDYYYRHPVQTLFGRGIGAPLIVKGSHNIYIELPNYIGLIHLFGKSDEGIEIADFAHYDVQQLLKEGEEYPGGMDAP